jgi:hypothetical protein
VRAQVEHDRAFSADDLVAAPLEETAGLDVVFPHLDLELVSASLGGAARKLAEDSRADPLATEVHDDLRVRVSVLRLADLQEGPGDRLSVQAADEVGQIRPRVEVVAEVLGARRRQPQVGVRRDLDHGCDVGI